MNKLKYTCIDLFSGPGGLSTGLKLAGFKTLIAIEINRETAETYCENHMAELFNLDDYIKNENQYKDVFLPSETPVLILGDISNVPDSLIRKFLRERFLTDTVDLVSGGPPCESYSIAGKRAENDHRDELYMHLPRIAKLVDAKMILFENVKGIFSKKRFKNSKETFFSLVCDEIEKEEFGKNSSSFRLASWQKEDVLLNCANYGVPQNRERVFLVGINNKYGDTYFNYPHKTHGNDMLPLVTVEQAIGDLPRINALEECLIYPDKDVSSNWVSESHKKFIDFVRGKYPGIPKDIAYDGKHLDSHKASKHFEKILMRMALIQPGESMKTAAERLIIEGKVELRNSYFPRKPYGARYRRLVKDRPSFTVTSHCFDEMIHPVLDRALTPREAARLQTFPDWYVFKGPYVIFHSDPRQDRYEQIGDAVPPLMGYQLGKELAKTLSIID
ncbi:DNA cytosine methyltransferase [Ornithinibacillus contaminans]|uniref:DNA cytosine methyltransferase n=1 Tax=Ornithinibacillus contaminans TaxID=694055 RepID=UPI00064DF2CA|nr:DNA cytosine methyltransferase [Ornithinibacillus contaminans]